MLSPQVHEITVVREWLDAGTLNFFGKPFAGKDTQADNIAACFDVTKISSGEILRNSQLPDHIRAAMNRGELIDTECFRDAVVPFLGQAAFYERPLILSSVGRMKGEEDGILAATKAAGHPTKAIPYLEITEDEALRRLSVQPSRGRADDTPQSLKVRLGEFASKTMPVLTKYQELGLLLPINAMAEPEVVFTSMIHVLYERALAA